MAEIGMAALRLLVGAAGAFIVFSAVLAAIKTFMMPRPARVFIIGQVFRFTQYVFKLRGKRAQSYAQRDRLMSLHAPITLFVVPFVLLALILIGYAMIYWALGILSPFEALRASGSSLLTLGNYVSNDPRLIFLEFSEAALGLILVALLIAYLPSMYSAFNRREAQVGLLEVRAGAPPSPWELISRSHRTGEMLQLREVWSQWHVWFAELEESHTSLPMLAFFRSPRPELSWVTAAGVVLDSASLMLSTVDVPWEPHAAYCIRSGYLALGQIALFFEIPFNISPNPTDPISISRDEYDAVCRQLAAEGIPLKLDLDQAWRDYSGWRVNYDAVLVGLAALTMAPYAPWSSDRSLAPGPRRALHALNKLA